MKNGKIILASESEYKISLLKNLKIEFEAVRPDYEEEKDLNLTPHDLCLTLALRKGKSLIEKFPGANVISSDQVLESGGKIMGKPGGFEAAFEQLRWMRNRENVFHTGIAVFSPESGKFVSDYQDCRVKFRELDDGQLERYLKTDEPYNCAGSFKAESAGIMLMEYIRTDDFTSLIGLPLIKLTNLLARIGYDPL